MAPVKIQKVEVRREPRTMNQCHRGTLSNLENNRRNSNNRMSVDNWFHDVNKLVDSSWNRLDRDMQRLWSNTFSLLPMDTFGLNTVDDLFVIPYPLNLLNRMERYMDGMRKSMGFGELPLGGCTSDFIKDAYEVDDNRNVCFKARFDVRGFEPGDVRVDTDGNRLTVHAKREFEDASHKSVREFCRVLDLPESIDKEKLQCSLTSDGVLLLEAPVKDADYKTLTFNEEGRLAIKPKNANEVTCPSDAKALAVKGTTGLNILDEADGSKSVHLEVPIEKFYKPSDVTVNVDSNRITVKGKRHDEKVSNSDHGMSESRSIAEFTHSFRVPETIDPLTVKAALTDGTLVLHAPLQRSKNK